MFSIYLGCVFFCVRTQQHVNGGFLYTVVVDIDAHENIKHILCVYDKLFAFYIFR